MSLPGVVFGCDEFEDVDDVSSSSFPIMYEDVLEDRVEQECGEWFEPPKMVSKM